MPRPRIHVLRSFNPIGQGAFVTEHFIPFIPFNTEEGTIVFDAGVARSAKGGKRRAQNLVHMTLRRTNAIYAVFVSHLDYDHISLIPYILKNYEVNYLIVPRFSCEQVASFLLYFLWQGAREGSNFIRIAYPEHFGNSAENIERPAIIYVDPIGPEGRVEIAPADLPPLDEPPSGARMYRVRSGSQIDVWRWTTDCVWVVVPFVRENHKSTALAFWNDLVREYYPCLNNSTVQPFFCGESNAYEKLREFIKCALDKDAQKKHKSEKRKLKTIYQKHWGDTNKDSMVVASFAMSGCHERLYSKYFCDSLFLCTDCYWAIDVHRFLSLPGALYTGDSNAGELPLEVIRQYDLIRKSVGSVQVPHHGSAGNWDSRFAEANIGRFFFAGYGAGNIYGHPSPLVVREIIRYEGIPCFYSENHPPAVQHFVFY